MLDFANYGSSSGVADNKPSGTVSFLGALENVGILTAAGAAQIGLTSLAKSSGVTSSYQTPYLTQRPTALNPSGIYNAAGGGTVIVGAIALAGVGLLLWAALRKG